MGNDNSFYKTFIDEKIISELCDICIDKNIQFDKCDYEFLISKMEKYEMYKDNFNFSLSYQQKNPNMVDLKAGFKILNPQVDFEDYFEDYTDQQINETIMKLIMEKNRITSEKFEQEINKLRTKFSKEELEYIDAIYILEKLNK